MVMREGPTIGAITVLAWTLFIGFWVLVEHHANGTERALNAVANLELTLRRLPATRRNYIVNQPPAH